MITIYTKSGCPNCEYAKTLLDNEGVDYETKNIEEDFEALTFLSNQGLRTLPQVYKNNHLIPNGYQGLLRLKREGTLK